MNLNTEQIDVLKGLNLKAVLFDMDGVLFDSMPHHAKAWVYAMNTVGVDFTEYEAYMREGMTGTGTISEIFNMKIGRNATEEECQTIYKTKSEYFESLGKAKPMKDVNLILECIKNSGLDIFIVTGSGQKSLLNKLEHTFPGFFKKEKMITAYDVKKGKPDPEPYLIALQKGNLKKNEAIVVENAPLGVKSAHSAGIYTVAVNTGILKDEELTSRGADILFHNMAEFFECLPDMLKYSIKNS